MSVDTPMTQNCPSWHQPTPSMTLNSHDVHLWRAFLGQSQTCIDQLILLLSADELSRAAKFHFETDRERFILCRGILRTILGRYLDIDPGRVKFGSGPYGKLYLVNEFAGVPIQFNLSRTQHIALYAFTSGCMIGVDVEHVRPISNIEQIAALSFSDYENHTFSTIHQEQKQIAFFHGWTRKEAYIKAIGDGLFSPLRAFDVSLAPNEPSRILSINGSTEEALRWSIETLEPASNHVAAVAIEGHRYDIDYYEWQFN
jgi:4'-phosphopantetheinyl transferase